ncbi:hypothetical protein Tco_0025337 [Tanacetum coccineum]
MLIYVKALLFFWAKVVATTRYTQNRSIIRLRHGKTPYELLHDKLHDLSFFHVFGALCYLTNDSENLELAASTGSPSSTIVDQDAPSPSNSQTTPETQSPAIPNDVKEDNLDLDIAHMYNNLFFDNIISELKRPVSTRLQLYEQALFCYYDAFLTSVEPKNYKDALTQACWIEAMQEELNEFEHLEVWELVPRPDKVMVITLKWIYKISQSPRGIFINQSKYALESLKKYGMESSDLVDTPMVEKSNLDEDIQGKAVDPTHYRGMIGTLMYLTANRPDLTFVYPKDSSVALIAYADVDYTGCQDTRRSTSGCMQLLGDRLVSWSSKRQKSVVISSTKAEYIAFSGCCTQITLHKEQDENGVVELYFINMDYQLADIFTKALGRERIEFFINKLGMRSFMLETLKLLADEAKE